MVFSSKLLWIDGEDGGKLTQEYRLWAVCGRAVPVHGQGAV